MTKRMNIPFSPPDMTEREVEAVGEVLRSGWITTGPKTKELERQMAEFTHTKRGACLNSATACMETALRLFKIGAGDEVIVPAYTYTASASVVCHVGATLKLIDVKKGTYELDYDALEAAITEKTKAVIPVDIAGVMVDYDRIRKIVESKKHLFKPASEYQEALGRVLILADSAHGYGASRQGLMSGECADFTSFSFHAVKNFTTGEGGGLVWRELPGIDDEDIYKNIMKLLDDKGVMIVVDATSSLLMNVLEYKPFLIKPNQHELGDIFGVKLTTREAVIPYARKLKDKGAVNVLISMGGRGAVLVADDGKVYIADAPKGTLKNSVGAGDSMVAGFITGWLSTHNYANAFKMGIAAGSASAFSDNLATKDEVDNLFDRIEIEQAD